ncbi:hypothetical protein P7C70_g9038, partial [Phenoliferia sp. Uapishka_3]
RLPPPPLPRPQSQSPLSTRPSSPAQAPSLDSTIPTPPPSPPSNPKSMPTRPRLPPSQLARTSSVVTAEDGDEDGQGEDGGEGCDECCCKGCASEMLKNSVGTVLAKRNLETKAQEEQELGGADEDQRKVGETPIEILPTPPPTKKSKKKKKKTAANGAKGKGFINIPASDLETVVPPPRNPAGIGSNFLPLSRFPPPQCCPPDRYELIDNLVLPLEFIRDKLAKQYIKMGGRMRGDDGNPMVLHGFIKLAEKNLFNGSSPEVQAFTQRTLAVSLQKLMEVFVSSLPFIFLGEGGLSQHPEVLASARQRLTECEMADRKIPIELPAMDQQKFMKWCHTQLRENNIGGHEWEGLGRSYRVSDFLISFSDAFDATIDRMVEHNPYLIAEDHITLLEWQGGVRAFDTAMRLGTAPIMEGLAGDLSERKEDNPLQGWGHLLELSGEARVRGMPFSKDLAEGEKKKGNAYFVDGEYQKSIVSFSAASIIHPTDPTYWTNAACSRMKIGTPIQYSEAVSDCTFALYYDRHNVKALYRRGTSLAMLGRWNDAIADLAELVRCAPDNQPAKEALAWAKKRKL